MAEEAGMDIGMVCLQSWPAYNRVLKWKMQQRPCIVAEFMKHLRRIQRQISFYMLKEQMAALQTRKIFTFPTFTKSVVSLKCKK